MEKIELYYKILSLLEEDFKDIYFNNTNIVYEIENYSLNNLDCLRILHQEEKSIYDSTCPKNKGIKIDFKFEILDCKTDEFIEIEVIGYDNLIQFIKFPIISFVNMDLQTLILTNKNFSLLNQKSVKRLCKKINFKSIECVELFEINNSFHYYNSEGKCFYSISPTKKGNYLVIDNNEIVYIYKHKKPKINRKSSNEIEIIGQADIQITEFNLNNLTKEKFEILKNNY